MRCIECGHSTHGTDLGGTRLAVCPTCAGRDESVSPRDPLAVPDVKPSDAHRLAAASLEPRS